MGNATVPTVYGAVSHFRGVSDTARIVKTIWGHRRATAVASAR